jgi:hypothetical protein
MCYRDEGPGEHDLEHLDDDKPRFVRCYVCQEEVYEHAERCPACGQWFENGAWYDCVEKPRSSLWLIVGLVVVLAMGYLLVGGLF